MWKRQGGVPRIERADHAEDPNERPAAAVLAKILPPAKGTDPKTYRAYVEGRIADEDFTTIEALHDLCRLYECDVTRVVAKIVKDKMGGKRV